MEKTNAWDVIKSESENIIEAIKSGEIKSVFEISEYVNGLYNYRVAEAITSIVDAYTLYYRIDLPFGTDKQ